MTSSLDRPVTTLTPPTAHTVSFMNVDALKASHPQVRKLKRQQTHAAHGNKVWRSSFVLIDYLSTWEIPEQSKVLDIGCGWGLTGIYLAKNYQAEVTGLDIDANVEPFLNLQASINQCSVEFQQRSFESLADDELAQFHTLMGTDICFWDEMTTPLFELIHRARAAGVEQVLIADPGRPPFWDLADRCVEQLGAEVVSRRIDQPWKTEKYILAIGGRD